MKKCTLTITEVQYNGDSYRKESINGIPIASLHGLRKGLIRAHRQVVEMLKVHQATFGSGR